MLWYARSLNTVGNCWSHCARRGSLDGRSSLSVSNDSAFTTSLCLPTNFKSTFNYYAIFDAAGKVHFALGVIAHGKTDREWLLRLERHEKLNGSYAGKLTIFVPFKQCGEHFIQDYDTRYKRCTRKVPRQAWVISADCAANVKGHWRSFPEPLHQATRESLTAARRR